VVVGVLPEGAEGAAVDKGDGDQILMTPSPGEGERVGEKSELGKADIRGKLLGDQGNIGEEAVVKSGNGSVRRKTKAAANVTGDGNSSSRA
jgi:hypothetical protein